MKQTPKSEVQTIRQTYTLVDGTRPRVPVQTTLLLFFHSSSIPARSFKQY